MVMLTRSRTYQRKNKSPGSAKKSLKSKNANAHKSSPKGKSETIESLSPLQKKTNFSSPRMELSSPRKTFSPSKGDRKNRKKALKKAIRLSDASKLASSPKSDKSSFTTWLGGLASKFHPVGRPLEEELEIDVSEEEGDEENEEMGEEQDDDEEDDDEEDDDDDEDEEDDDEDNEEDNEEEEEEDDDDDDEGEERLFNNASRSPSSIKKNTQNIKSKGSPNSRRRKTTKSGSNRKPRSISTEDRQLIKQMMHTNDDPAVIVHAVNYRPARRRPRVIWSATETMHLRMGVERFGLAWSDILNCPDYRFKEHRTQVDLKDKWRNMANYRPYGSHGIREFIIVDENHEPINRAVNDRPYHFKNRWPRDAALKAASRNEFYPNGTTVTTVYVREINNSSQDSIAASPPVHVYEATRYREAAPPHLSQLNLRSVWTAQVRKIREEIYVSKEDLNRIEKEKTFNFY